MPPVPAVPARAESAQLVDLRQRLSSANSNLTRTREKLNSAIAESKSRMTRFVREDLPTVALYGGGGAMLGALLGYWLHDQMKGWFGEDSYIGLLGTAALGVVVIVATPQLLKVTVSTVEKTAALQSAGYGLGVGLLGVGAYRAYQEWPAS